MSITRALGELTERELLIVMIEKFERLEDDVKGLSNRIDSAFLDHTKRIENLELDVREIKTKVAIYAMVIGSATSVLVSLITHYLKL